MCTGICVDMCVDMRANIFADICMGTCIDACAGMCIAMCVDMCIETFSDVCVGMCADMCVGMYVVMCTRPPARTHARSLTQKGGGVQAEGPSLKSYPPLNAKCTGETGWHPHPPIALHCTRRRSSALLSRRTRNPRKCHCIGEGCRAMQHFEVLRKKKSNQDEDNARRSPHGRLYDRHCRPSCNFNRCQTNLKLISAL